MLLHFFFAVKLIRGKVGLLVMKEPPSDSVSAQPEIAGELYRAALDHHQEGRFALGIDAFERSLAIYQRLSNQGLGDYLHERFQVWYNLGKCYRAAKRAQEAVWSLGESLKILRQLSVQDPDPYLRFMAVNLVESASLHQDIGQAKEAEALFLEALNLYRQLGQTGPGPLYDPSFQLHMGEVLMNLGDLYLLQEKYQHAEPACLEALQIARAQNLMDSEDFPPYVAKVLSDLGHIYRATGRNEQAEQAYLEGLSFSRKLAHKSPWYIYQFAMMLQNTGSLYAATQRLSQAEPLFAEALELLRLLVEKVPAYLPALRMVLGNLIRLYDLTGRPAQAASARRELEAILRDHPGRK